MAWSGARRMRIRRKAKDVFYPLFLRKFGVNLLKHILGCITLIRRRGLIFISGDSTPFRRVSIVSGKACAEESDNSCWYSGFPRSSGVAWGPDSSFTHLFTSYMILLQPAAPCPSILHMFWCVVGTETSLTLYPSRMAECLLTTLGYTHQYLSKVGIRREEYVLRYFHCLGARMHRRSW